MSSENYWVRRRPTLASRRRVLGIGMAGGLGLVGAGLTGCGDDSTTAASSPATSGSTTQVASQPKMGGTLRTVATNDPASFDLHQEVSFQSLTVVAPLYSTLVQYKPGSLELTGDLAAAYEQSGDGNVTFTLRDGVKWHDGKDFTAQDVLWNLDRMRNPPTGVKGPRTDWFDSVDKVDAPDSKTVRITVKYPRPWLLQGLGVQWTVMLPPHAIDSINANPIGTGAFAFDSYEKGVALSLKRNPNFYLPDRPFLDGINVVIAKDARAQMDAFSTNQIDMLSPMSRLDAPLNKELQGALPKGATVVPYDGYRSMAATLNTTRAPFNDPRVRLAFHLILNRQQAVEALEEGMGTIGTYLPPDSDWGVSSAIVSKRPGFRPDKDGDLAEAKKLLDAAGIRPGSDVPVEIITRAELYAQHPVWLTSQLKPFGFAPKPELLDSAAEPARMTALTWDARYSALAMQLPDPDNAVRYYITDGGYNFGKYSDATTDSLLEKQGRELDLSKRKAIVADLIANLEVNAPGPPVYFMPNFVYLSKSVRGFVAGPGTYSTNRYTNVWMA